MPHITAFKRCTKTHGGRSSGVVWAGWQDPPAPASPRGGTRGLVKGGIHQELFGLVSVLIISRDDWLRNFGLRQNFMVDLLSHRLNGLAPEQSSRRFVAWVSAERDGPQVSVRPTDPLPDGISKCEKLRASVMHA